MEAAAGIAPALLPKWLCTQAYGGPSTSSLGALRPTDTVLSACSGVELRASTRLSLALLAGAAVAGAHRRRLLQQVRCRSLAENQEEAERELEKLEAELEALEEAMGEENAQIARQREAEMRSKVEQQLANAPEARASAVSTNAGAALKGVGGRVAVCGTGSEEGSPGRILLARLKEEAPAKAQPVWLDLAEAGRKSFEEVDELLTDCTAAVICPDPADGSPEALEAARQGLKAVLASAPYEMNKVVLLSHVGAQAGKGGFNIGAFFNQGSGTAWSSVEDELTATARTRSSGRPLRHVIVRVGDLPAAGATSGEVRCLPPDEEGSAEGLVTSPASAAEALFQVFNCEVNSNFSVVEDPALSASAPPNWPEMLLPFIGPELWRMDVPDPKRAVFFVQQWADEFFRMGKSAMRMGVKTPVMVQNTPSGVIFKFRPLGTESEVSFDDLDDGGLEFVVEEPAGAAPRLRAKRCAYGWKVTVKENSERALLEKFKKDWEEVSEK
eukprot:gb/GFBE01066326.1/.p1 GENE.gb/GFBE01066326.1/~~gb/GFBE01066326.1/.p1  ORF type:complete len:499 (+),score=121.26 gb/GFBE01066326.1/:1-1497(+)